MFFLTGYMTVLNSDKIIIVTLTFHVDAENNSLKGALI